MKTTIENAKIIFAKKLKGLLEEKDITQKELAKMMGWAESSVSKWLNLKDGTMPKTADMIELANYFDKSVDWFLYDDTDLKSYDSSYVNAERSKEELFINYINAVIDICENDDCGEFFKDLNLINPDAYDLPGMMFATMIHRGKFIINPDNKENPREEKLYFYPLGMTINSFFEDYSTIRDIKNRLKDPSIYYSMITELKNNSLDKLREEMKLETETNSEFY